MTGSDERLLRCERLVTGTGVLPDAGVRVRGGQILAVDSELTGTPDEELSGWVVPGFVDTHCHGGGGGDYADRDPESVLTGRAFHLRGGTTTSLASLVTAEIEILCEQIRTLRPLVRDGHFAGIHLEGPFLSREKAGAHDPRLLRPPDEASVDQLLAAADGTLAMITMAPELPGADAALARFTAAGVTVAFGHSDADATIAANAVAGGATVVTHLFNAMRPIHHRDPGPIPRLLTDPGPMLEMISDGFHLHPDVVLMIIATAGPDRVALITDAFAGAGMPDGEFRLGALRVALRDGQAHLINTDGSLGAIASSTLTMGAAVRFLVGHGVPVPDVARMASTTPARGHRLVGTGVVEPGAWADLCVLDDQGDLQRVLHRGEWVSR